MRLESDLWSLGALICWLARDGELRTRPGLPFGQPDDQVCDATRFQAPRHPLLHLPLASLAFPKLKDALPLAPGRTGSAWWCCVLRALRCMPQVAKWGDRPNGRGSQEPFYMLWEDILPPLPAASNAADEQQQHKDEREEGQEERARVMALLRRLAQGLMRPEPLQRTPAAQVRVAVAQALLELEQRRSGGAAAAAAATAGASSPGAQPSRPARGGSGRGA